MKVGEYGRALLSVKRGAIGRVHPDKLGLWVVRQGRAGKPEILPREGGSSTYHVQQAERMAIE